MVHAARLQAASQKAFCHVAEQWVKNKAHELMLSKVYSVKSNNAHEDKIRRKKRKRHGRVKICGECGRALERE